MDKPFSLFYEEFKMGLANLINNSDLPMSIIEPVLQNCLTEVREIARQQYQSDKARYEKMLFEKDNKPKEPEEPEEK